MSAATFATRLTRVREQAIAELFASLPRTVKLVSFLVDEGDIQPDRYLDAAGRDIYPAADVAFGPLTEAFGHNLTALAGFRVDLTTLDDDTRRTIAWSQVAQYGQGSLYVLRRPARRA